MSEGLGQGPYVAAGLGFESATLRTQGHHAPHVGTLEHTKQIY